MTTNLVHRNAPLPWIRDFAIVGATTGLGAPLAAMVLTGMIHDPFGPAYVGLGALAGLATGAVVGALARWALAAKPSWPKAAFIALGIAAGATWGAVVGALAGTAVGFAPAIALSALLAAPVGAAQLGWFGISYALRRSRRRPVRRLVVAAAVAAPALAVALLTLPRLF